MLSVIFAALLHGASAETPIERGSAGYEEPCSKNSDCASNNCYKYKNTPGFCDRARGARSVDSLEKIIEALEEREARYSGNSSGTKFKGPNRSGTKFPGRRMD